VQQVIDHCAHPDHRAELQAELDRATAGRNTPHVLDESPSWHVRCLARRHHAQRHRQWRED
jgi:succinyl-CoA:acetate CoA-transferase